MEVHLKHAQVQVMTTRGTESLPVERIYAVVEGTRPHSCILMLKGSQNQSSTLVVEEDWMAVELRCQRVSRQQG